MVQVGGFGQAEKETQPEREVGVGKASEVGQEEMGQRGSKAGQGVDRKAREADGEMGRIEG